MFTFLITLLELYMARGSEHMTILGENAGPTGPYCKVFPLLKRKEIYF